MHYIPLLFISYCFFYSPLTTTAQSEGSFQLEAMTEGNYYWQQSEWSITTGIGFNYWFSDHIAINYECQLGYDNRYGFAMNTGWGQVAAGFLFSEFGGSTAGDVLGVVGILALIIPEGVTFAINPDDDLVFMPYLIPFEAHYLQQDKPRFRCAGEVGLKMHYRLGDYWALRPKIGVRYLYSKQRLGIEVGLGMVLLDTDKW
ncbi:hypothetical protein [Aureispira anguillae]|uniref:Uncharacterized protein n=1 Tax=Aureispira anguillae TaxID=2864201 RepID=A0A915YHS5_9BACT|nr:hypothetical protein [Aureispira anguillae]BDS13313.1 hypothetical protein AsAng_0040480 [Aureispira anguillae]